MHDGTPTRLPDPTERAVITLAAAALITAVLAIAVVAPERPLASDKRNASTPPPDLSEYCGGPIED
jgi:hypothetical protein